MPQPPGQGQESVWDYPRPPRIESSTRHLLVVVAGETIAETRQSHRVLETSHPPVYYFPAESVAMRFFRRASGSTHCEWKGAADYFDIVVGGVVRPRAAWSYPNPDRGSEVLKDAFAFYAAAVDVCTVDGQPVTPQAGAFYGGWITADVVGPFKGGPGTNGW